MPGRVTHGFYSTVGLLAVIIEGFLSRIGNIITGNLVSRYKGQSK